MADINIADFQAFIKHQIKLQETIEESLSKIKAYIEIALLSDDFYDFDEFILRDYFWGVTNIIETTIGANQDSLKGLMRHVEVVFD